MAREQTRAWRPEVPGVTEVLHAHFTEHAYPAHVHGTWTLLLVDTGGVDYALDGRPHRAAPGSVTVLPPDVPHDGRAIHVDGFDKRVLYLEQTWLDAGLVGPAVSAPLVGADLARSVSRLHDALELGDSLEAESRLALVSEEIGGRLDLWRPPVSRRQGRGVAREVRDRLDACGAEAPTLVEMAAELGVDPTHVVRAFRREYGIPPHQYLTGRRVDRARRLLLAGEAAADVAVEVGFHDQSHLIRHFRRVLGVTPRAYLRSA
ncbi:MAG: AraC family transcriptional regulator [Actinomycetales bacterium]|nr:MAG: AraC family transcriptional regulator [Actinomycetales bacterium]